MESEENQKRVSLSSHSPWKSLCDSHIPTAPAANADGKVEIQKQDSHFPTARFSLTKFGAPRELVKLADWRGFQPSLEPQRLWVGYEVRRCAWVGLHGRLSFLGFRTMPTLTEAS